MSFGSFFGELKRRNVLKAALAYLICSWVTLQAASILFSIFNISQFWLQFVVIALIIGLGIWLLLSWYFQYNAGSIRLIKPMPKPESDAEKKSYRLNSLILWTITSLLVCISLLIYYGVRPSTNDTPEEQQLASTGTAEKSVAVLPFLDLSPDKDHEYFSDGISEEILNYLSKNPELRVISRTSCFSFKNKAADIRAIGQKLNANYILEGSVRRSDSIIRITVQLIRAEDGFHLWSENYQRKITDVFQIQDEIAMRVTQKLQASLLGDKFEETDPEAYTKYLQAKSLGFRYNRESAETALELIGQSLAIDSTYSPSWLLKSKLHFQIRIYARDTNALADAQLAAERAISLNAQSAEAYAWLGRFHVLNSNFSEAYTRLQKALSLNPNNGEVLRSVSSYPTISLEDRIQLINTAISIDPLEPINHRTLAIYYFFQTNFQQALESLDTYLLYRPYGNGDHGLRAEILAWLGCAEEALIELEQEKDNFSKTYSDIMTSLVLDLDYAAAKIEENREVYELEQPYLLAQMYAYMNNRARAYELLETALNANDYDMYFQLKNDPYMYRLRQDDRFKNLLLKMNMPKPLEINLEPNSGVLRNYLPVP